MKLSELKESTYGARLYRMPSDEDILREARWGGGDFAEIKQAYEALWAPRHSLHKLPPV